MSIHFDASRDRFVVRWKQDGRRRIRRFRSEAEAIAFDASLLRPLRPAPIAASVPSAAAGDGIYAYETRGGTRYRFVFRQSDGTLSTRRGFTSRRAAATARRRLVESIERGEVKVTRETLETFWQRLLEQRRPYMTKGSWEDFQTHGRKRLLPSLGQRRSRASTSSSCGVGWTRWSPSSRPASSRRRPSTTPAPACRSRSTRRAGAVC